MAVSVYIQTMLKYFDGTNIKVHVFARRNDEAILLNCSNSDCFVPRSDGTNVKVHVFARRNDEAILMNCSNSDCFVPRSDGTNVKVHVLARRNDEAISMNCSNSDCFVPRSDNWSRTSRHGKCNSNGKQRISGYSI
jgi:hypothetical protein